MEPAHPSLEVEQDPDFQRREWRMQRVGSILIAVVVLGGLLGVFGDGPLSHATARSPLDTLVVHYERFTRRHGTADIAVDIAPGAVTTDTLEIWLDRTFAERSDLEEAIPRPLRQRTAGDSIYFTFSVARATPLRITFRAHPDFMGSLAGHLGLSGRPGVAFHQFAFP